MSENTTSKLCAVCGAELVNDEDICGVCGSGVGPATEAIADTADTDTPPTQEKGKKTFSADQLKGYIDKLKTYLYKLKPCMKNIWQTFVGKMRRAKKADEPAGASEPMEASESLHVDEPIIADDSAAGGVIDNFALLNNVKVVDAPKTLREKLLSLCSCGWINRVCVFVAAALLFAMLFVPFAYYQVSLESGQTYQVSFSPVDSVVLTARSFVSLREDELADTDLYQKTIERELDGARPEWLLKQRLMLRMMQRKTFARLTMVIAAAVSLLYGVVCTFALILSLKALIQEILKHRKGTRFFERRSCDRVLCVQLCLLPALMLSMRQMCDFGTTSKLWPGFIGNGVGLSFGAYLSFGVALLGTAFVCLVNFLELVKREKCCINRARIKTAIGIFLVVLLMVSVFLPMITLRTWNASEKAEALYYEITDISELSSTDMGRYRTVHRTQYDSMEALIRSVQKNPDAAIGAEKTIVNTLLLGYTNPSVLFGVMMVMSVIVLVFAGLLLYALLGRLFFGQQKRRMLNSFRIFALLAILVDTAFVLVLISTASAYQKGNLRYLLEMKLGIGMILMLAAGVCLLFLRLKEKAAIVYMDTDYDNVDASYAPYVLEQRKK